MITFAGVSGKKNNKNLRYTSLYNKSDISNDKPKNSAYKPLLIPFNLNVNTKNFEHPKVSINKLTSVAFNTLLLRLDWEVIFTITNFRQGIPQIRTISFNGFSL
jgi:hypothetical protein